MNIIEAAKTGLPMRRKAWGVKKDWLAPHEIFQTITSDIIANDWEVNEPKVVITRDLLMAAWDRANSGKVFYYKGSKPPDLYQIPNDLAKELGL